MGRDFKSHPTVNGTNIPVLVGGGKNISVGGMAPLDSAGNNGDLWFPSDASASVKTKVGGAWVDIGGSASDLGIFAANIGDGTATSIVVTHNLGTQDIMVATYRNASPYTEIEPTIERTSINTITLKFDVAPTTNQFRVVVTKGAGSAASGTTTNGIPTGGTAGQVLGKATNTDYDVAWVAGETGSNTGNYITFGNTLIRESSVAIIPNGSSGQWDETIREIGNIVIHENTYYMVYSGYSGVYSGNNVYVGYATSADGKVWAKQGQLTLGRSSEDPYLVRVGSVWHLFVEDKEEVPFRAIRKYNSSNLASWVDDGHILQPVANTWESRDVSSPTPWHDGSAWHLLYEGRQTSGQNGAVGYATSSDGLSWTRSNSNPVYGPAISWADRLVPDDIVEVNGRFWLFTHAYDGSNWRVGLAVSPKDPLTWTDVGQPINIPASYGTYGNVQAAVTPNDGLLLTFDTSNGIYRASLVSANTSSATTASTLTRESVLLTSQGLITENFRRVAAVSTSSLVSGTVYYHGVALLSGEVATNVHIVANGAAAGTTLSKVALYSKAGVQLAVSPNLGTDWESVGTKTNAFSMPYSVPANDIYYVALLFIGTTGPTLWRGVSGTQTSGTVGSGSRAFGSQTSQIDMPTPGSINAGSFSLWVGVS